MCPICPVSRVSFVTVDAWLRTDHRKTPRLCTCAVARKSPVGEKAILTAKVGVRKASIKRPVGRSNVRMTESWLQTTSHLESAEKA